MKKILGILFCFVALVTCQQKGEKHAAEIRENVKDPANPFVKRDSLGYDDEKADTIILYEDSIKGLSIPFDRKEMLPEIQAAFEGFEVTKSMGYGEESAFHMYSIKKNDTEYFYFAMDWEDSFQLYDIRIKEPLIKDQYGLKVGDGYQDIKANRGEEVRTLTDYHQHTYAFVNGSHILYEINGDIFIPDTADMENLSFTEEQIKDWKIIEMIWLLNPPSKED